MIGEMIKEYLVGLGVKVDKPGFQELDGTIKTASNTIETATGAWTKNFVEASAVISTSLAGITTAIGGVMKAAASQDLEMEKLARRMMVSKDAAWEMKKATDALGESVEDIVLTPELMDRCSKLVNDGRNMKVGGDFEQTMKSFRDLMFEFTRLKQEVSYAMTWVGYYLLKYLNRPLAEARETFRAFNDSFVRNMSVWTEKAASALMYIINVGIHFWDFIKNVTTGIYNMWEAFPRGVRIATASLTAFFLLLRASPFGRMIALVSTLLLLIDDYFGYMEGKQALFGKYWDMLNKFIDVAKEKITDFADAAEPILEEFVEYVLLAKDKIVEFAEYIYDLAEQVKNSQAFTDFVDTMSRLGQALWNLGSGIIEVISAGIKHLYDAMVDNGAGSAFSGLMGRLWDIFLGLIDAISYCIEVVTGWLYEMEQSDTVREFFDAVVDLEGALAELIGVILDLCKVALQEFFKGMDNTESVFTFRDALRGVVKILTFMIQTFTTAIKLLSKFFKLMLDNHLFKAFWEGLGNSIKIFTNIVFGALSAVGKLGEALIALIKGDFKGAYRLGQAAIGILTGSKSKGGRMHGSGANDEQKMWSLAQQVGSTTGIDARYIYGQWYHESDGFTSQLWKDNFNAGGLKGTNGQYMHFDSPEEFAEYFAKYIVKYDGVQSAESVSDYAGALKSGGYFEDDTGTYINGINNGINNIPTQSGFDGGRTGDFNRSNLRKWSSTQGMDTPWDNNSMTDTSNFQPTTARFLDAVNTAARERGVTFVITGGAEGCGLHSDGTYSHANGYKVDISDDISTEQESILQSIVDEFPGSKMVHEADKGHYDIFIAPHSISSNSDVDADSGNGFVNLAHRARRGFNSLVASADPLMASGIINGYQPWYTDRNNVVYNVNVGGVTVAKTDASPQEIGRSVGDATLRALNERGKYMLQSRTLTGGPNLV